MSEAAIWQEQQKYLYCEQLIYVLERTGSFRSPLGQVEKCGCYAVDLAVLGHCASLGRRVKEKPACRTELIPGEASSILKSLVSDRSL